MNDPYKGLERFEMYDLIDTDEHHKDLVNSLSKPGGDIIASLTSERAHLLHMAVGVAGEAGELLDAIKKYVFYNKELDVMNVVEELGDLLFYMQGIAETLNTPLSLCKLHNILKLEKRYGGTYTDQAAQTRADKDE